MENEKDEGEGEREKGKCMKSWDERGTFGKDKSWRGGEKITNKIIAFLNSKGVLKKKKLKGIVENISIWSIIYYNMMRVHMVDNLRIEQIRKYLPFI